MNQKDKFPTIPFVLLAVADFLVSCYLISPNLSLLTILLHSMGLFVLILGLMVWSYNLRQRLLIKRLLRKNITGEKADELLELKKKSMVQAYYGTLATLFIIGIIIRIFGIPDLKNAPFWQYLLVITVATILPDLFFYLYNEFIRKRVA